MSTNFRPALVLFLLLSLICTVFYPAVITLIGRIVFPTQAEGSLLIHNGQLVGSSLIGQSFSANHYFWGRPSATTPIPNNAASSNGSNLGPTNPEKIAIIKTRIAALKAADPQNTLLIPIDLVTASASGLDPDISLAAAFYQVSRIARERQMTINELHALIIQYTQPRYGGIFGEPRVNVLRLNLALDEIKLSN
ncbi:potassium-transporting ATPase subunit KdpC [Legionella brunensis]|uniref:Potassium-transporting ATPase KdpC subunit n=1 Tax=Legionella brunensis TaxID=29422 RepID=A0A0W0SSE6_9GAMM|nr:potassium-transporting ATPase subunit KdpC [Legionella brunensis]KTC86346.1 potassium translocating ATPase, subunit C [Legionella brunensis]